MSNCNSGGRFLTTACTVAQGLPDDCDELETLRWFRDNWLSRQPGGESAIRHYCEVSPQIVEKINNDSDEPSFFDILYHQMILPSVSLIKAGKYEEAYALYRSHFLGLEKVYIAPNNMKREESALDSCETIRNDEELFHTALEITFAIGYASVSVIQRILHLGYSQTAQIIDEMEKQGIVAPFNDDCPRRLLITKEQWEQKQLLK